MKELILRFCHWALALLGLGAANGCNGPRVVCEYGVPTMEYRVSGKVIDSLTDNPIKGIARHPILEDNVIVYSNATILGRIRIGKGAIIGGNIWVTEDVKPGAKIMQRK